MKLKLTIQQKRAVRRTADKDIPNTTKTKVFKNKKKYTRKSKHKKSD